MPNPAGPPAAPPDAGIVFGKFSGMKNTVQAERLGPDDLARAKNVTLDDTGQLSRRRGYTLKTPGTAHSLWNGIGITLVVFNGQLCQLNADFSATSLGMAIPIDPAIGQQCLSYCQIQPNDVVYFTHPLINGKLNTSTMTVSPWQGALGNGGKYWLSPVVNPTATLSPVAGKMLGPPPLGQAMDYFNGHIYIGSGNMIWRTELYTYDYVDVQKGFLPFEANITMVGAVADGVYVGTEEGLWFMSPSKDFRPEKAYGLMKRVRVMDSPVLAGSMVKIPGELGNPPQIPLQNAQPIQVALMFTTTNGMCVAGDGGLTTNLTEQKFFFPGSRNAQSAFFRRQDGMNQYIVGLNSAGDPVDNAAIGDYVEATLIRAADAGNYYAGQNV